MVEVTRPVVVRGKRGGRGLAGINKHRVMTRIKYMPKHWGMHGFNRDKGLRVVHATCNVSDLERLAQGNNEINLTEMNRQTPWKWKN